MDFQVLVFEDETDIRNLVVLDLMLPGLGGLEVCRRLREPGCDTTVRVPIAAMG